MVSHVSSSLVGVIWGSFFQHDETAGNFLCLILMSSSYLCIVEILLTSNPLRIYFFCNR
jgi:hypothetical protein